MSGHLDREPERERRRSLFPGSPLEPLAGGAGDDSWVELVRRADAKWAVVAG